MGNAYMRAKHGSGLVKRVAINVEYEFLRRSTRGPRTALTSPHASTLEVGMIYHTLLGKDFDIHKADDQEILDSCINLLHSAYS
ncbi:unnamed protein product [Brassica napus]|uniref:(rape) hypothetical protein n=1 Tax=Brassica napus TaxID=3708 RepID=A0A816QV97_BRANA|nr:unnamed protein product [Brassica napus]